MEVKDLIQSRLYRELHALSGENRDNAVEALILLQDNHVEIDPDWSVAEANARSMRVAEMRRETGASMVQRWGDEARMPASESESRARQFEIFEKQEHSRPSVVREGYSTPVHAHYDWSRLKRKFPDIMREWHEGWQQQQREEGKPTDMESFLASQKLERVRRKDEDVLAFHVQPEDFQAILESKKVPSETMSHVLAAAVPKSVMGRNRTFIAKAHEHREAHPEAEVVDTDKPLPAVIKRRMAAQAVGSLANSIRNHRESRGWGVEKMAEEFNAALHAIDPALPSLHYIDVNRYEHFVSGTRVHTEAFADAFWLISAERDNLLSAYAKQSGKKLFEQASTPGEIMIASLQHLRLADGPSGFQKLSADTGIKMGMLYEMKNDKKPISFPLMEQIAPHLGAAEGKFREAVKHFWEERVEQAETTGQKLTEYRERAGLLQKDVAGAMGVKRQRANELEVKSALSPANLMHMMPHYQLSLDEKINLRGFAEKEYQAHKQAYKDAKAFQRAADKAQKMDAANLLPSDVSPDEIAIRSALTLSRPANDIA